MFADNHKISNKQIQKMLVFDICSIAILILPGIAAQGAGRDGLIAIIIGSLAAFAYAIVMLWFTRQIDGDYLQYSRKATGRTGTALIALLYLLKIGFSCVFTLSLFANVIRDTLLPNTSYRLIIFTLIFVSVYSASKGIEARARTAEILFYIVLIPLFLLLILGLGKIRPENLLPLFTSRPSAVLNTSYSVLLIFSSVEILIFAAPTLVDENADHKRTKSILSAIGIATILSLLLFVITIGLLGDEGASQNIWSAISILQVLEIPGGFVQRQDAIILTFWLMSIFTILSTYFYYMGKITNDIIPVKKRRWYLYGYAALLFLISGISFNMDFLFQFYGAYMKYIGLPQSLVLPLIIIITARIRKPAKTDKEDDYEEIPASDTDILKQQPASDRLQ